MKLSISLVTGEGELLGACPPYLVHITIRPEIVAVKLIGCDVSHKANWWLCRELTRWNYQEWVKSSLYGPWRAVQGSPGRVGWVHGWEALRIEPVNWA